MEAKEDLINAKNEENSAQAEKSNEGKISDFEKEQIPYLEDIKTVLKEIKGHNSQPYLLSDLANDLEEDDDLLAKFVKFFDEEFQKQIEHFEVLQKLEESKYNVEIRKIVPQISYVFSCPNLRDTTTLKEYLKVDNKPEHIKKLRELHKLENPSKLKDTQKDSLQFILNNKTLNSFLKKVPGAQQVIATAKVVNKNKEAVQNAIANPGKIKENIEKSVKEKVEGYAKKVTGGLNQTVMEGKKLVENQKEKLQNMTTHLGGVNMSLTNDYSQSLLGNSETTEMKNLNIDNLKSSYSSSEFDKSLTNENTNSYKEDNLSEDEVSNKTPLLDKGEGAVQNKNENASDSTISVKSDKDSDKKDFTSFYLNDDDISEEEFEKFLIVIFDKLDEIKKIILKESIVKLFPKVPDVFLEKYKKENINSKLQLYFHLISYFATIVNYFTGLDAKFYLDEADLLNIDFYLPEIKLKQFAKSMDYKTQYRIISTLEDYHPNTEGEDHGVIKLRKNKSIKLNNIPYEKLSKNDISQLPPFVSFNDIEKCRNYYRRYDNNNADNYHLCKECYDLPKEKDKPNFVPACGSSYFRHIDKQRIVFSSLNSVMDVRKIIEKQNKNDFTYQYLFLEILYVHNYETFESEINQPKIFKTYATTIFEDEEVVKLNNNIRNFIGEEFGFYYFWLTHLIKMLIFPSIVGALITLVTIVLITYYGEKEFDKLKMDMYLFLPFSCLIIIWSKIYLQSWLSREKFYKYIWGMNEFFLDEAIDSKSGKDANEEVKYKRFLDIKLPVEEKTKQLFKKTVSWLATSCLFGICIGLNIFVFWLQNLNLKQSDSNYNSHFNSHSRKSNQSQYHSFFWIYVVPSIMYFVREFMTLCYYQISRRLTKWEGHHNYSDYRDSFVLKASFFQFFNFYFNLYYIAFVKRFYDSCLYDNCKEELASQLTLILVTAIVDDVRSLGMTIYNNLNKDNSLEAIKSLLTNTKKVNDNNGSNKDQFYERSMYEEKNADKEYVQIIMTYGYIIQFGTASPICFLFALIQAFIARIVDSLKMTKYAHVNLIDGSKGLGSHIKVISFLNVIGMITNITINLFVDDRISLGMKSSSRWLMLFLVENLLLIVTFFISFDTLPNWFKFKNKAKISYLAALSENKEIVTKKINNTQNEENRQNEKTE